MGTLVPKVRCVETDMEDFARKHGNRSFGKNGKYRKENILDYLGII